MKILNALQIRKLDAATIQKEPISSIDLMERAAQSLVRQFRINFPAPQRVAIFCGLGNNGGDGLCMARMLSLLGYDCEVFIIEYSQKKSSDFILNETRLRKHAEIPIKIIQSAKDFPVFTKSQQSNLVVIDAIFGSGLSRPLTTLVEALVQHLNEAKAIRLAIDLPSGLMADASIEGTKFRADLTYTFEVPKLSLLLPENFPFVGEFKVLPIGLLSTALKEIKTPYYYLEESMFKDWIRKKEKFAHKGTHGHALIMGGSKGKVGAILLAAKACLKAGTGLLTAGIPGCASLPFQTAFWECMVEVDKHEDVLSGLPAIEKYRAIGIGPGLGQNFKTEKVLQQLLEQSEIPLVLDADALNIIAQKGWQRLIPKNSILTPHPKEFERLTQKTVSDYEQLETLRAFSNKYSCYVCLKRAHTVIACPNGDLFFNSSGNPAMGTAGSGDVLTGFITGLLSQGYSPKESAILGVFYHGRAGDKAVQKSPNLIAGDLIEAFGFGN